MELVVVSRSEAGWTAGNNTYRTSVCKEAGMVEARWLSGSLLLVVQFRLSSHLLFDVVPDPGADLDCS